jgi:hypothetical protein
VLTPDAPTPDGCRHCGIPEREHLQRWHAEAGWHPWTEPTDEQRLERMRARRLTARIACCKECGQPYEPEPCNRSGFCSWGCFDMEQRDGAPEAFLGFMPEGVTMIEVTPEGGSSADA